MIDISQRSSPQCNGSTQTRTTHNDSFLCSRCAVWLGTSVLCSRFGPSGKKGKCHSRPCAGVRTKCLCCVSPDALIIGTGKGGHLKRGLCAGGISRISTISSQFSRISTKWSNFSFISTVCGFSKISRISKVSKISRNGLFWKDPFCKRPLVPKPAINLQPREAQTWSGFPLNVLQDGQLRHGPPFDGLGIYR